METVKQTKEKLKSILEQLEKYDENLPFKTYLDDNNGGFYLAEIRDFSVDIDSDCVIMSNY